MLSFYDDLQKLIRMKPIKLHKIKEKEKVYKCIIIQWVNYIIKVFKIIMIIII